MFLCSLVEALCCLPFANQSRTWHKIFFTTECPDHVFMCTTQFNIENLALYLRVCLRRGFIKWSVLVFNKEISVNFETIGCFGPALPRLEYSHIGNEFLYPSTLMRLFSGSLLFLIAGALLA